MLDNYNDYMPKQYIRVVVNNKYTNYTSSFAHPRVLFFKRTISLNKIHLEIFKKISPLFARYYRSKNMDPEDYETNYAKIFSEENKKEKSSGSYSFYSYSHSLPYKIKIINKLDDLGRRS